MASFVYEPLPPEQDSKLFQDYVRSRNVPEFHPQEYAQYNLAPTGAQSGAPARSQQAQPPKTGYAHDDDIFSRRLVTQHHRPFGPDARKQGPTGPIIIAPPLPDDPYAHLNEFDKELFELPPDREDTLVHTGTMYNPYTNETMDTYEEAMPAPNRDYSKTPGQLAKSNLQLIGAQGGYDQNAFNRSKTEVCEDMQTMADGRNVFGDAMYADAVRADTAGRVARDLFHNRNGDQDAWDDARIVDEHKTGFVGYQNMARPTVYAPETQRDQRESTWIAGVDAQSIPNPPRGAVELMEPQVTLKKRTVSENISRHLENVDASNMGLHHHQVPLEHVVGIRDPKGGEYNVRINGPVDTGIELPSVRLSAKDNPLKATKRGNSAAVVVGNAAMPDAGHAQTAQGQKSRANADVLEKSAPASNPSFGDTGGWTAAQARPVHRQDSQASSAPGNAQPAFGETGGWTAAQKTSSKKQDVQSALLGNARAAFGDTGGWTAAKETNLNRQDTQSARHSGGGHSLTQVGGSTVAEKTNANRQDAQAARHSGGSLSLTQVGGSTVAEKTNANRQDAQAARQAGGTEASFGTTGGWTAAQKAQAHRQDSQQARSGLSAKGVLDGAGGWVTAKQTPAHRQDSQAATNASAAAPSFGQTGGQTVGQKPPTHRQDAQTARVSGGVVPAYGHTAGWTAAEKTQNNRQDSQSAASSGQVISDAQGGSVRAVDDNLVPKRSTGRLVYSEAVIVDGSIMVANPHEDYRASQGVHKAKERGLQAIEGRYKQTGAAVFNVAQPDTRDARVERVAKKMENKARVFENPIREDMGNQTTAQSDGRTVTRGDKNGFELGLHKHGVSDGGTNEHLPGTLVSTQLGDRRDSLSVACARRTSLGANTSGYQAAPLPFAEIKQSQRRPSSGGRDPSGDIYTMLAKQVREGTYNL